MDNGATGEKSPLELPITDEKWSITRREALMNWKFWAQSTNSLFLEKNRGAGTS